MNETDPGFEDHVESLKREYDEAMAEIAEAQDNLDQIRDELESMGVDYD